MYTTCFAFNKFNYKVNYNKILLILLNNVVFLVFIFRFYYFCENEFKKGAIKGN